VEQLLPTIDSLDPRAQAEVVWTAAATAREVGDDRAALAARRRQAPLLTGIDDPYLHVASQLTMAWTSPIVGDLDGACERCHPLIGFLFTVVSQPVTDSSSRTSSMPAAIQAASTTASCSAQVRTFPDRVTVVPLVATATLLSSSTTA
jgi:hypothetical protein